MTEHLDLEKIYAIPDGETLQDSELRHLENCPECKAVYDEILQLSEDAKAFAEVQLPAGFVEGVMANVREISRARKIKRWSASFAGIFCAFVLTFAAIGGINRAKDVFNAPDAPAPSSPKATNEDYNQDAPQSADPISDLDAYSLVIPNEIDRDMIFNLGEGEKLTLDEAQGEMAAILEQAYGLCNENPDTTYAMVYTLDSGFYYIRIHDASTGDLLADIQQVDK